MKKHIITIAGLPGSGKSSTAKAVALALGYEHFSSGDLFRKMAEDRGLSVEEINFAAEKQKEIDKEVDELLVKLGKEKTDLVIEKGGFKKVIEIFSLRKQNLSLQAIGNKFGMGKSSIKYILDNPLYKDYLPTDVQYTTIN